MFQSLNNLCSFNKYVIDISKDKKPSDADVLYLTEIHIKGALSGLGQFLAAEIPLKMMKNVFYFTSKALFVLKIFKFLTLVSRPVSKRLDKKDKVNFKCYDVTACLKSDFNINIC